MVDISIVSGTYNRLSYLKRMVESGRKSIGSYYGLSHEFVLVDGGSTDGTQDWINAQPDCRLIQHHGLLGAVKAFNDGAFASHGNYVILANDDIEFLGETIWLGWLHMQLNPDCGIGCFYQDRNGLDWHVENMTILVEDSDGQLKTQTGYYGQVCIVPKWLGDRVSWWGDGYLHTYGGDNEISCNVYELGYKVTPIPGTKVHDNEADDDLRKKNNVGDGKDPRKVYGHHPDSFAWGRKWRKPQYGMVGPIAKSEPMIENESESKERVVYLPIYEQGWEIQKQQKRGLREALARVALVAEFDYVSEYHRYGKELMLANLQRLISKVHPTIVLTQLHNGDMISPVDIVLLKQQIPTAKFINWNGDYWPDNLLSADGVKLAKVFDLQTTVNRDAHEKYQAMDISSAYWQIGWEPDGVGHEPGEYHDVVFLASGYSQERQKFVRKLRGLDGFTFGLYGQGWPEGWAKGENLYNFIEGCKIYRGAKISLGDSQWPDSGFVSNRVMQALAAGGSALAHQWFRGMDELGLIDGETCIIWNSFNELEDKIKYYLNNEDDRLKIAQVGERLALEKHSFDARVKELFDLLGRKQETVEDWRW